LGKFWRFLHFRTIWSILWPFGIFCGHFGIFFPVLVCCAKKYLATLDTTQKMVETGKNWETLLFAFARAGCAVTWRTESDEGCKVFSWTKLQMPVQYMYKSSSIASHSLVK
jgi:hypothetical protein